MVHLPLKLFASLLLITMAAAGTTAPSAGASRNGFAADIFSVLTRDKANENIVYSPASIQSCLTLAFIGAGGRTADELRQSLRLGVADKTMVANTYGEFLKKEFKSAENGPILKMANRVYVNKNLEVASQFNEIAAEHFNSQAEQLNFADSSTAVTHINSWVEKQTENKIRNLLAAGSVDGQTSAVLVNAIYFKAKWAKPFSLDSTSRRMFYVNGNQKREVETMFQDDTFGYADLPDLDAKALSMPYANTDLSMLLILPNKNDGLKDLESKLANMDLNEIEQKLQSDDVFVYIPKFKIEFDVDLKEPLGQLNIKQLFSDDSDLSALFANAPKQKVSKVQHKAYLDVNEAGSEAAAATYLKIVPMSLNLNQKTFQADHPFMFAIRNKDAVFFAGHVSKF